MKKILRSFFSLLLVAALTIVPLSLAACKNKNGDPGSTGLTSENESGADRPSREPPDPEHLQESVLLYLPKVRAVFENQTFEAVPVGLQGEPGAPDASVSASWNAAQITLTVTYDRADRIAVRLGSCEKTVTPDGKGRQTVTVTTEEMKSTIVDLGQELPLSVRVEQARACASFEGSLLLNDYELFLLELCDSLSGFNKAKLSQYNSAAAVGKINAGVKTEHGSLLIYDQYSTSLANKPYIRCMLSSKEIPGLVSATKTMLFSFDVNIQAMPEYQWNYLNVNNAVGLSAILSTSEGGDSIMVGLLNTANGIVLYLNGDSQDSSQVLATGKKVGERFNLSMMWNWNRTQLDVFVNNVKVGTFQNALVQRTGGFGNRTLSFVWQRGSSAAAGTADDFIACIDHIGLAYFTDYTMIGTISEKNLLNNDVKTVEGENTYLASQNLILTESVSNSRYGLESPVVWKSSAPDIISHSGVLYAPEASGELVVVTAYLLDGNTIVSKRNFRFFVKAQHPADRVLLRKYDSDPITGAGNSNDTVFIADQTCNSIIYNMGAKQKIERAELYSWNEQNRITGNFVSLYYSDDNITYTAIPEFQVLNVGSTLYFYNFSVDAQYLKIHFQYEDEASTAMRIIGSLQKMLVAHPAEGFLLQGAGSFSGKTSVVVQNTENVISYNRIVTYTLGSLGIAESAVKPDGSDVRFRCGEQELPYYYDDGVYYVRVLESPPQGAVTLDVFYGNPQAESVSDPANTFEAEYGTRIYTSRLGVTAWRNSVALMPDGSLLKMGCFDGNNYLGMERSTDGGRTWSVTERVAGTVSLQDGGGFVVDRENNAVYYFAYTGAGNRKLYVLFSGDSGRTWRILPDIQNVPEGFWILTYSDGIKLSTYDGSGPAVDYVMTVCIRSSVEEENGGLRATSVYSVDAGQTWILSNSRIDFGDGSTSFEGGVSEETVYEQKDGTLILYARCQMGTWGSYGVVHFAVSHSYDHGVTWVESATLSNVYTSNTQPIILDLEGIPVLLWGGNNSVGGFSYCRFPMSIAYSTDDGETFVGTLDISFQTIASTREPVRANNPYEITNPDIVVTTRGGVDCAYVVSTNGSYFIENFSNYLYKTNGAYDSFELGSIEAEGWVTVSGEKPTLTTVGAVDGNYAMRLRSGTLMSRSVPYLQKGRVSFDFYVDNLNGGFTLELQSAYNPKDGISGPLHIWIDSSGNVYSFDENNIRQKTGLQVTQGSNRISLDFDCSNGTAALTVNGNRAEIPCHLSMGNAVCFAYLLSGNRTSVAIDRFTVMSMD